MNRALLAELVDECDLVFHLAAAVGVANCRVLLCERCTPISGEPRWCWTQPPGRKRKSSSPQPRKYTQVEQGSIPRRRRSCDRTTRMWPLELRLLQGSRRISRPFLPARAATAPCYRPLVQHCRSPPSGDLWHGSASLRPLGPCKGIPSPSMVTAINLAASAGLATSCPPWSDLPKLILPKARSSTLARTKRSLSIELAEVVKRVHRLRFAHHPCLLRRSLRQALRRHGAPSTRSQSWFVQP